MAYYVLAMSGLFLSLLAVVLTGFGSRDQSVLAAMSESQGRRSTLLVVAILCAFATATIAMMAAYAVIPMLAPRARIMLAAIALVLSGIELFVRRPARLPREPTQSLFAAGLVILAHQLTDAPRFMIFAVGIATAAPEPAAIGGIFGSVALLTFAWIAPEFVTHPAVRKSRWIIGGVLIAAGLILGNHAFG